MLRRIGSTYWIVFLLIFSAVVSILLGGYSSLDRAEQAEREGSYALAAESFAHAARFLPWRRDLFERAGINAAQAGDFSAAVGYFEKGDDFSEQGWIWYCTSHIQLGNVSEAAPICNKGAERHESAGLYSLLAFIYREEKDWEAERLALENQTRLDSSDAYAAYRLGMLSMLLSPDDALPELTRASTLNPEVDSAVQTLRAALAVSSQQNDPSMQRVIIGQAFGLVQDWELATAAFEEAIRLNDINAEAWAWLGEAKQQTGQDGSAELDRALSLDRNSVSVRALRGLYWSRKGKYEQMLAEYLLAAGIEPENPRWRAGVGEAYAKLGDLVLALESYQRAVELEPNSAEYLRLLAVFCAENTIQVEEIGLPAAQQAFALAPTDPVVLDTLGYVYLSTGRFANAELVLKQAIDIAPEFYSAHIHLALTYLAQGNRAAAFNLLTFVRDAQNPGGYADAARQLLDKYFR